MDDLIKQIKELDCMIIKKVEIVLYEKKLDDNTIADTIVLILNAQTVDGDKGKDPAVDLTLLHNSPSYFNAFGNVSVHRTLRGTFLTLYPKQIEEMFGELFIKAGEGLDKCTKAIKEFMQFNCIPLTDYISLESIFTENRTRRIYEVLEHEYSMKIKLEAFNNLDITINQEPRLGFWKPSEGDAFRITLDYYDGKYKCSKSVYSDHIFTFDDFKKFIKERVEKGIYPMMLEEIYKWKDKNEKKKGRELPIPGEIWRDLGKKLYLILDVNEENKSIHVIKLSDSVQNRVGEYECYNLDRFMAPADMDDKKEHPHTIQKYKFARVIDCNKL